MLKGTTYPPEVLSLGEARALLGACGTSKSAKRNKALIVLLWRGGLRLSEALALHPKDIDFQKGHIRVLHGKGDKARTTSVDPEALAVLSEWNTIRDGLKINGRRRFVCTLRGNALAQSYVRDMLRRVAAIAGIEKRVHAHGLRHTFAHDLIAEGAPIHYVRDLLGHSTLSTTDRYLRALGSSDAVDFASQREWE